MRVSLTTPPRSGGPGDMDMIWSYPKYQVFQKLQNHFASTAIYRRENFTVTGAGDADQFRGELVEASYFPLLGIPAAVGRTFLPEEDAVAERDFVAMISHDRRCCWLWPCWPAICRPAAPPRSNPSSALRSE